MKKIREMLIASVMLICVLCTGCTSETSFSFSYKLEKTEFQSGERFELTAEITNTSGKSYQYEGASSSFSAAVKLYCNVDGKEYILQYEHTQIQVM